MRHRAAIAVATTVLAVATAGCRTDDPTAAGPTSPTTTAPAPTTAASPSPASPAPASSSPASSSPEATPSPTPTPSQDPAGPPEVGASWTADDAEVAVSAKQLAVDVVRHLTEFEPDGDLEARLASVPFGTDRSALDDEALAVAGEVLDRPGTWARSRVEYPQLGGFRDDATSVMVVVEQAWRAPDASPDAEPERQVRTVDVRLERDSAESGWRLVTIDSVGGAPVEVEPPSDVAAEVLAHPDLLLPDSARWDILAGDTTEELLELLVRMADRVPVEVAVLDSGHPRTVFGTDRPTRHAAGLAVDVHTVDGTEVVAQRGSEDTAAYDLVAWLFDQPEVAKIGSPWALDGFGGRSFTDFVHQDHLHVVVEPRDD